MIVLALVVFAACSNNQEATSQEKQAAVVKNVNVAEFDQLYQDKNEETIVLDVRTAQEYASGHLDGAVLLNVNDSNFRTEVAKLDKDAKVLVYCAVGGRSAYAATIMEELGFKDIYNLKGGIQAWGSSGKKIVR